MLREATGDGRWTDEFRPRRGHLLEVPRPRDMPPLQRGLMEGDYAKVTIQSNLSDILMSHGSDVHRSIESRVLTTLSSVCELSLDKAGSVLARHPESHDVLLLACNLQHYSTAGADDTAAADQLDVTFTATTAADETLLVGSSRDVSWDQAAPDRTTVAAMLARAQEFLPALAAVEPTAVRVGLRPQVCPPTSCSQAIAFW